MPSTFQNRAVNDLQRMAHSLDQFKKDHGRYPDSTSARKSNVNSVGAHRAKYNFPSSFAVAREGIPALTTPVPYLHSYYVDFFAPLHGPTFSYLTSVDGQHFVLWSAGPDKDYDINDDFAGKILEHLDHTDNEFDALKARVTFDRLNGYESSGDIWIAR
jgi:hypothetical protein